MRRSSAAARASDAAPPRPAATRYRHRARRPAHGTWHAHGDYGPQRHTSVRSRLYNRRVFFKGQTIGKYRILSPLGSGGFGSVYLAEDTWIDKKVALKVPHKQNLDFSEMVKE